MKQVNDIKSLYGKTNVALITNQIKSTHTPIYINRGLQRDCGLSTLLFDLYINKGFRKTEEFKIRGNLLVQTLKGRRRRVYCILWEECFKSTKYVKVMCEVSGRKAKHQRCSGMWKSSKCNY
jgi:hypothetical protein